MNTPKRALSVVVVDTNAIIERDWHLSRPYWSVLLAESAAGLRRVVLPEVVVREAIAMFRTKLAAQLVKLASAEREVAKLTGADPPIRADEEALVNRYEQCLRDRLAEARVTIDPIPSGSDLDEVLDRVMRRVKPVKQSGAGMCDAMIWTSVRNRAMEAPGGEVAFVSGNTEDFAESGQLHRDLEADLHTHAVRARVRLFTSLKDFVESQVPENPEVHAKALELANQLLQSDRAQITENVRCAILMADTELLHGIGTVEVLDARVESIQISAVDAAGVDGLPLDLAAVRFDAVADIRVDIYGFSPHVNGGEVVQELADVRMELEIGSVADTSAGTLDEFAVVGPVQVEFELDV